MIYKKFFHHEKNENTFIICGSRIHYPVYRTILEPFVKLLLENDGTKIRMRSSRLGRASDSQCRSRNCPGFDPSILRHSKILGAAGEAVLNIVKKNSKKIPPLKKFYLLITVSAFLIFPLVERATSAKQVQVMTGLHPGNKKGQSRPWIFFSFLYIASSRVLLTIHCDCGCD